MRIGQRDFRTKGHAYVMGVRRILFTNIFAREVLGRYGFPSGKGKGSFYPIAIL